MNTRVWIKDENVEGTILTEMTHGAIVAYELGGFHYEELMDKEDYVVKDEMFFDFEEIDE